MAAFLLSYPSLFGTFNGPPLYQAWSYILYSYCSIESSHLACSPWHQPQVWYLERHLTVPVSFSQLPLCLVLIWNHGLSSFRKKNPNEDSGGGIYPEKHVAGLSMSERPPPLSRNWIPERLSYVSYLYSPFSPRDKGKINSWLSIARC